MKPCAGLAFCFALIGVAEPGTAQPWQFGETLDVAHEFGTGIFHHLESSGRRNIAISGSTVAVAWEDDHDGTPRVYLALKHVDAGRFDTANQISGNGEAYEPSLAALPDDRFVVAWEEDGRAHARVIGLQRSGPVITLADSEAGQANVSVHGGRIFVLRAQREARFSRIRLHVLRANAAHELSSEVDCAVDPNPLEDHQFYPASAVTTDELIAAWEDRRPGHTIIMASAAKLDDVCTFRPPVRISERRSGEKSEYGKGHGVSRVALGGFGAAPLWAVWADKRHYWEGYDIYAARYEGNGRFGPNIKVQDEFGDFARQWHAAIAGNSDDLLVVAWSDERDGSKDIMLSWSEDGVWSEDMPLPGASGAGQQAHPSVVVDSDGNLHVAWIDRAEENGPTRLRYLFGRIVEP